MRGIGQGQTIHLLIIPEVANRITADLEGHVSAFDGDDVPLWRMLVPAWLLVNSMRMEAMQFSMLSLQEVDNLFRKIALPMLQNKFPAGYSDDVVLELVKPGALGSCVASIEQFQAEVDHTIESRVPTTETLAQSIANIVTRSHERLLGNKLLDESTQLAVNTVSSRHTTVIGLDEDMPLELDSEREQVNRLSDTDCVLQ